MSPYTYVSSCCGKFVVTEAHHGLLHASAIKLPAILEKISEKLLLTDLASLKAGPRVWMLDAKELFEGHLQ